MEILPLYRTVMHLDSVTHFYFLYFLFIFHSMCKHLGCCKCLKSWSKFLTYQDSLQEVSKNSKTERKILGQRFKLWLTYLSTGTNYYESNNLLWRNRGDEWHHPVHEEVTAESIRCATTSFPADHLASPHQNPSMLRSATTIPKIITTIHNKGSSFLIF
jgi:hypothetical protein